MKKSFLFMILLSLAFQALACEEHRSDFDQAYCSSKEFFLADSNLNLTYGKYRFYIGEEERAKFRSDQNHWLKIRNKECSLKTDGKPNIDWKCAQNYTSERIDLMEGVIGKCIKSECNLRKKSKPIKVNATDDQYVVEYLSDKNIINTVSSSRFGRKIGEACMRFVGNNENEYLFGINNIEAIRVLDYVSVKQIQSWPKRFDNRSDIPKVRIMVFNRDGSSEIHSMYSTLYLDFIGKNDELLSLHPGRLVYVWFPRVNKLIHPNGIKC